MHILPAALMLAALGLVDASAQTATSALPLVSDRAAWNISNAQASNFEHNGRPAIHLISEADSANGVVGMALPRALSFSTGTISLDLKGKNVRGRSFLGVVFNVVDEKTFEAIYFRPFNFKAEEPFRHRAVQYLAWPNNTWEHLRTSTPGQFENALTPVPDPDGWFHAQIEVNDTQVKVFVNGSPEPSLTVRRLATGGVPRPVGLFVDSADGDYANFVVSQDKK